MDNQGRTILRIIADINLQFAINGFSGGSIGIYVDTAEAVAAGATMEPRSDSAPWMWLRQFNMTTDATSTNRMMHIPVDVKARRKLDAQSELMLVFESGGLIAALGLEIQGRVLLAQP